MALVEDSGSAEPHEMTCMEILGGIEATERAVKCPGMDVWIRSRPFRDESTGGDVHYLSLCGGGVITRVLVGDVSGHGEHVREYAEELRRLVKRHIVRKSQRRFMRDLNRNFTEYADLRRFATAVVMTYLSHNRSVEMCIAGHPRPAFWNAGQRRWSYLGEGLANGAETTIGVTNMPIGVDERHAYDTFRFPLVSGDSLLLYTDALVEARSPDGRTLGETGLMEMLAAIDPTDMPCSELGQAVLDSVVRFRGGQPSEDDETLMVLKHTGTGPKGAGLAERLDAVVKMLRIKDF
ncbi:SpoIIE family protein phosphatase [bacterium]|nr:SpoIIE family protein phosphatase [bacterium]